MAEIIPRALDETAAAHGERPALAWRREGAWRNMTWSEYRQRVRLAARGLMALGTEPGAGVAIMGFNRPEWFIADLASIACGAAPAGIYTTCTADQCAYVAHHCEAAVAVLEDRSYLERFADIRDRLPHLRAIVLMEGKPSEEEREQGVHTWEELLALGETVPEAELEARIDAQQPDDLATLIYTSGTTGTPKAVMLSHRNILWVTEKTCRTFQIHTGEQVISYLPLSHIAEQVVSLHCPMVVGASSWFAESIDKLGDNLRDVRPHFFFAVPRVWEKVQARIQAAGAQASPLQRRIGAWARRVGLTATQAEQRGSSGRGGSKPLLYPLAKRLVFDKVRRRLGLDRARICATSAAPISVSTLEFFGSLGIPIMEVYGMSEVTGPGTFSTPDRYLFGAAGYAIPGTELRTAEDGEILMRGPHVFLGYYKNEEATRETLDEEGWVHSGDIGRLDERGLVHVTDRKKEMIITSGGKNIAPQPIEGRLKSIPAVAVPAVIGDRRNYLTALLTLDPDRLPAEAEAAGSDARDLESAAACPKFRAYLEKQVEAVNSGLARFETVKRFAVLAAQFTPETGELTPTMKLKRRVIHEKYAAEIDALYSEA